MKELSLKKRNIIR